MAVALPGTAGFLALFAPEAIAMGVPVIGFVTGLNTVAKAFGLGRRTDADKNEVEVVIRFNGTRLSKEALRVLDNINVAPQHVDGYGNADAMYMLADGQAVNGTLTGLNNIGTGLAYGGVVVPVPGQNETADGIWIAVAKDAEQDVKDSYASLVDYIKETTVEERMERLGRELLSSV